MHKELQLYHGDLHCGNILVSKEGRIKIGNGSAPQARLDAADSNVALNVGDSMIEGRVISKDMAHKNLRGLGLIMVELMEPKTSTLNPDSIILQQPEKWPGIYPSENF